MFGFVVPVKHLASRVGDMKASSFGCVAAALRLLQQGLGGTLAKKALGCQVDEWLRLMMMGPAPRCM
jgi:hypothetical protein